MSVDIRLAVVEDAAELARLLSPLGYDLDAKDFATLWPAWEAEGNTALVVPGEGALLGTLLGAITLHRTVVLHRPRAVGRITSLVVDPTARGKGLGRALVMAAEAAMIENGCGLVEVTSHVRRSEAHSFYEYLGYERTSFRFARDFSA